MTVLDRRRFAVTVILGVGLLAFFVDLGQEVRLDGREIVHAEISREMAETGNYAVPHVLGRHYIDKPPLYNWIVAILFEVTGRPGFTTARFPAALSALAVMVGIYILGRRWFSPSVGLLAALIWPTFLLTGDWAHMSRGDMLMAALIFWAVLLVDLSAAAGRRRDSAALWCVASLLITGAVMSKGLQALVFVAVPAAGIWRARRAQWIPPLAFLLVTVLMVVAAVGGWSLAAELRQPGHMKELLNYEFGEGLKEHPKRFYLYFDQFVLTTLPWSIFAIGAVLWPLWRLRRRGYGIWAVPALTLGVCVLLLTLLPNKRAHYALPVLPMWALLLSAFMSAGTSCSSRLQPAAQGENAPKANPLVCWLFVWPLRLGLLCVLALLVAAPFYWVRRAHSGKALGAALLIAAAVAVAYSAIMSWSGKYRRAVGALLMTIVFLTIVGRPVATHFYYSESPDLNAIREISQAIPKDGPLGEYRVTAELLYLKMDRRVDFLQDEGELKAFLQEPGVRYLLVRAEDAPILARLTGRHLREIGAWSLHDKGSIMARAVAVSP